MAQQTPAGWYADSTNSGRLRWWDGSAWTDEFQDERSKGGGGTAAHSDATTTPYFTFTDHRLGKNAKVSIYRDRIEWIIPRTISGAKIATGVLTAGLSFAATGVKSGKGESHMIPVHLITGVTTRRDGALNTIVRVTAADTAAEFRISHAEAAHVKLALTEMMRGTHTSATTDYSRVDTANQGSTVRDVLRSTDYVERDSATRATAGLFKDVDARFVSAQTASVAAEAIEAAPASAEPPINEVFDQIRKLGELRDAGLISDAEFEGKKTELLGRL